MSTAAARPWTCPQCQRRVPARQPRCHCGFERASLALRSASVRAVSPPPAAPSPVLALALAACALGLGAAIAVRLLDRSLAPGAGPSGRAASEVRYPTLPAIATPPRRAARAPVSAGPPARASETGPSSTQGDWTRAVDLPLRRVAADTSVLELRYRPFADACLRSGTDAVPGAAPSRGWLASLKTAELRSGVTLVEAGATMDCEAARRRLVARADALKADLDAAGELARAGGARPAHWRKLLAVHQLDVWDGY
jgi:hypothetical protein